MPEPTETSLPALNQVNASFHEAYEAARDTAREHVPVLVVLADTLTLLVGSRRESIEFSPELFHVVKSVVHGPVAAFAAAGDASRLQRLQGHLERTESSLAGLEAEPELLARLQTIVSDTRAFVARAIARPCTPEERRAFAGRVGPLLLASTDDATCVQLAALDAAAAQLLGSLSTDELAALHVVVAGAHQARARSLGMQFFGKLLGADADERLAYAEQIETEEEALALVGMRRLDRVIGEAFFGEATRLERDILGDSVKARLADYHSAAEKLLEPTSP